MKTKRLPMTFDEARDSLPLYAVGMTVRVWYMGLLGPDESLDTRHRFAVCRIEGIRLKADDREGWDEEKQEATRDVFFPNRWEYLAVNPFGVEDGWFSEEELREKGYPTARKAGG